MYATINYLLQWKSISLAQTIGTVLKPISESGSANVSPAPPPKTLVYYRKPQKHKQRLAGLVSKFKGEKARKKDI